MKDRSRWRTTSHLSPKGYILGSPFNFWGKKVCNLIFDRESLRKLGEIPSSLTLRGGVRKEGGPIFRLPKTWEEPITLRPQSLRITHMSPLDPSTGGKKSANKTQKNDSDQTHHPSGRYWRSFLTGRHVSLGR